MRVPRDLDGAALIRGLGRLGYEATRQSGSHVRLTRRTEDGEHHVTVPIHRPLRVGTLNAILSDVARALGATRDDILRQVT